MGIGLAAGGIRSLGTLTAAVFLLNLPFGYWRANTGRFTLPWFLAIHLPVPVVIALRILLGIGWQLATLPVVVAAYFTGQYLGGRLRRWKGRGGGGKE